MKLFYTAINISPCAVEMLTAVSDVGTGPCAAMFGTARSMLGVPELTPFLLERAQSKGDRRNAFGVREGQAGFFDKASYLLSHLNSHNILYGTKMQSSINYSG
jgi:hypothetical protein